jgi:catechol 2,3-dioxygenase-like lactoylglutathione lyase family enzyme
MTESAINHLNLVVSDLRRSLDFYVGKLGFRYVRSLNRRKVILEYGGFDFFLEQAEGVAPHPRFHFGIQMSEDDVYKAAERLRAAGVTIVVGNNPDDLADVYAAPDGVRHVFYFQDPDGYIVEVYSHIGLA